MSADRPAELVSSFLADAHDAALRRDWAAVLDLAGDVLVLDHENADALTLQTLAERHVGQGHPSWGRRQETVLFADLVASTALANRFDPELVRNMIRRYELACTPVITALGGHVHRFVGDGILASFGYPSAHEDDARRAVQAALDLVAAVASTSAEPGRGGVELEVRVGVASGVLVHADRGAGSWTQAGDLFGPAVNLAARLHEVARPGHVCISEETAGLVAGLFELELLGVHELKGFDAAVVVHGVVRRTDRSGWFSRAIASPFVGREIELAALRGWWALVTSPDGAQRSVSVSVSGDAGVGKSRLVREFIDATTERSLIELQCSAYRARSPLHPVRAAIERRCGFEPDDDDATRLAKLSVVLDGTGLDVPAALPYLALALDIALADGVFRPEVSPGQLRETTLRHLIDWVVGVAARAPTLLVLEDLHWADPSTRDLLQRLMSTRPPGLLTIVTSRTPPGWLQDTSFEHLTVEPLSHDEATSLADAVAGGELSSRLVAQIARRSDGIPLFVEQLADSLARAEQGSLGPHGVIPLKLAELLQARLDSTGSSKRVAQLAATIGREFEPEVLETVVGRLQDDGRLEPFDRSVSHHLDRLVDANLVEPDPKDEHRLRFRHALVGEAAYESQLLEERPERHYALARLLLERGVDGRSVDASLVAHHFELAARPVEAIEQYLAAATTGLAVGAFAEVTAGLGRAEGLLDVVPDELRPSLELAIRLSRGLAISSAGGYAAEGVIDDYARAVELCEALRGASESSPFLLRALLGLWTYYCATGNLEVASTISDSMAQQLERAPMAAGRPSYHACRGVEHFFSGDLHRSAEHLDIAVELFGADDVDPLAWPLPNDPLAAALGFLGPLRFIRGDERGGVEAIARGLEWCQHLAFPLGPFSLAFVRNYEAWMHRLRGDVDASLATAMEVLRIGEQHGFFDWLMTGRIHLAAARALERPSVPALEEMGEALGIWRAVGGRVLLPSLLVEQGWGYLALGDYERAAACLADADEMSARGQLLGVAEIHRLRAELAVVQDGPAHPSVAEALRAGMRFAAAQGASLFVVRCGMAYERTGGEPLDPDLRLVYDEALMRFGPDVVRAAVPAW